MRTSLGFCRRTKKTYEVLPQRGCSHRAIRRGSTRLATATATALALWGLTLSSDAHAQILGTAESFGILAGSTVTNTGPSVVRGNVGVSPGSAITGFPPGIVVAPGTIHDNDAVAAQAQSDLTTAYNTLQSRPPTANLTGQDLGGMFLSAGVYKFNSSAQLTGVLTLNGQGNSNSEFVFQIGSTLTTASNSAVLLINKANGDNVFWAVGSSATLGTNTAFAGNIVALTSITLNTGASLNCGRALARNGAVTMDTNSITLCVPDRGGGGGGGGGSGGSDTTMNGVFGEGVSGAEETAFEASRLFRSAMMEQSVFWLAQGFPGNAVNGPSSAPQTYHPLKLAPSDGGEGFEGIVTEPYHQQRTRVWGTGFGGTASLDGNVSNGSSDLNTHAAGFALGLEHQITPASLVGVAGGYTNSGFSVDQLLTKGNAQGAHVGIYGVQRLGQFYVAATGEYAHFDNDTERSINFLVSERATGKFTSNEYSGYVETGWQAYYDGVTVTPFAGYDVGNLKSGHFAENSDGILGLNFASNSITSQVSTVGMQLDTRMTLRDGEILTPFARAAWAHEFNPDRGVTSNLLVSPAALFSPEGAPAAEDAAKVDAGLKLDATGNIAVFAFFDGEFSGQGQSYAGNAGVRVLW